MVGPLSEDINSVCGFFSWRGGLEGKKEIRRASRVQKWVCLFLEVKLRDGRAAIRGYKLGMRLFQLEGKVKKRQAKTKKGRQYELWRTRKVRTRTGSRLLQKLKNSWHYHEGTYWHSIYSSHLQDDGTQVRVVGSAIGQVKIKREVRRIQGGWRWEKK